MKKGIQKSQIATLIGVIIALFALVCLFSYGTVFGFLSTFICMVSGFLGFWVLLPFLLILGIYIIFRRQLVRFKLKLTFWGIFVVILSLLIITSNWGNHETLMFNNCIKLLKANAPYDPFTNVNMGGGFIGYVLAGIMNNAITLTGTSIVSWVLFVTGLLMILNKVLVWLFKKIKNHERKPKKEKNNEETIEISIGEELPPVQETKNNSTKPEELREMKVHSFNDTHGLQRPQYCLEQETTRISVEQPAFSRPIFGEEKSLDNSFEKEEFVEKSHEFNTVESSQVEIIQPNNEEINPVNPEPIPPFVAPQPVIEPEPQIDPLHRPQPKAIVHEAYCYPKSDLLIFHESPDDINKNEASCAERTEKINEAFRDLGIGASVVSHTVGPSVTRFDVQTNSNVSSNNLARFISDVSIRLNGLPVRFEQIVYGKPTSGLEVPNEIRTNVGLRESINVLEERGAKKMEIIFGKNISGELITANLQKFPHMLVAGTTGSGKSIFIHSVILTLLMRNTPQELRLMLIDPKKVEFSFYKEIPHLLCPNISEPRKAYNAMQKLVNEMERRYNLFVDNDVRDIEEFNVFAKEKGLEPLPFIVVFVDEYADLSDSCKEIEAPVVRIAQKARSAGIHLVIATQRPSVNVINGVIKSNIPTHVALMCSSAVDSGTIIGVGGAEQLLGNGDMLVECSLVSRTSKPRVQSCFVDSPEIKSVTDYIRAHHRVDYDPNFLDLEHDPNENSFENARPATNSGSSFDGEEEIDRAEMKKLADDELYELIKENIMNREYCSISYLTRTFAIGFPKAGRMFNKLVVDGLVSPLSDSRGSKVLQHSEPSAQQMGSIEQSTFTPNSQLPKEEENELDVENNDFEG